MATAEEKQELVEDIKRPIRYYRISLWGYGAEYSVGESSEEEYNYWVTESEKRIAEFGLEEDENAFEMYMLDKDHDKKWDLVPEELKRPYDYYEYTDIDCIHGPTEESAHISIEEIENPANDYTAKPIDIVIENMEFEQFQETYDSECVIGECDDYKSKFIFTASSSEKGTFFSGTIETPGRIDLSKLTIHTTEIYDGDVIIHDVEYDGEFVINDGCETNIKGTYINLVRT
jgi:hypothetical protein